MLGLEYILLNGYSSFAFWEEKFLAAQQLTIMGNFNHTCLFAQVGRENPAYYGRISPTPSEVEFALLTSSESFCTARSDSSCVTISSILDRETDF